MINVTQLTADWFNELEAILRQQTEGAPDSLLESIQEVQAALLANHPDSEFLGRDLIERIIRNAPQYGHLIPRDLFWFLGGECLHYLGDEELTIYQQLEDYCYQHPNSSFADAKAAVFKPN